MYLKGFPATMNPRYLFYNLSQYNLSSSWRIVYARFIFPENDTPILDLHTLLVGQKKEKKGSKFKYV